MLILGGGPALSPFALERFSRHLRDQNLAREAPCPQYFYLIDSSGIPKGDALATVENLLDGTLAKGSAIRDARDQLLVVPRFGTRSPWSTKATDIAQRCGLEDIRRIERGTVWPIRMADQDQADLARWEMLIHDPMTESVAHHVEELTQVFAQLIPGPLGFVDVIKGGLQALTQANRQHGYALTLQECEYLTDSFRTLGRNPTDAELMMFAQVNSEHCRHKIFNASWSIDDQPCELSLFEMIRTTHTRHGVDTLSAYKDNAAVLKGYDASWFLPDPTDGEYRQFAEPLHLVAKVETHNHPTAISPFPGAATGSGGEIRDEGATGRGGKPKAGVTGFSVSDLRIPDLPMPWELPVQSPDRIALPLQIMLEGPIGAAAFNNEFGRPNIAGYFRTLEISSDTGEAGCRVGYHKPIMIAGGMGNIRDGHVQKRPIPADAMVVVLGGPAMLIGLGGGAASSVDSGKSDAALDFASVQRGNAEMQRRCQEVIDRCIALGDENPIVSVHDVGAGGLSNALPELVHDAGLGAHFHLDQIPSDDASLSPMQLWCNEAQERYVLAIAPDRMDLFTQLCERERCLFGVVGRATQREQLILDRDGDQQDAVSLPMSLLFGNAPRMHREAAHRSSNYAPFLTDNIEISEALERVLRLPCVADKTFLVTIGDRSVGGQISRDQMVGPWQVPVADAGITTAGFDGTTGEAIAMGERTPLALINAPASGRMAVGEAITNIACAGISKLSDIRLCANWMAAAGEPGQDAALYDTVHAVAMELCPALGISIPVGKDSMSMATRWQQASGDCLVTSPVSLVVTAFAPVADVRSSVTPELLRSGPSTLILVDLGRGRNRLGASALAQVYAQVGTQAPDVDRPNDLCEFFKVTRHLLAHGQLLAYHDRSDGGAIVTLLEMAFASRCSLDLDIGPVEDPLGMLFSEELGAVLEVPTSALARVQDAFASSGLAECLHMLGSPTPGGDTFRITAGGSLLIASARSRLHKVWSELSCAMQTRRDNPLCAAEEHERLADLSDPGLHAVFDFDLRVNPATRSILSGARPTIAVLREQGVNGHMEMAAAFDRAGFAAIDVTMSDLYAGRRDLADFTGFVACGGFSFGDVLGAGMGWAKSILFDARMRDMFREFFERPDSFALGVCNGCQMMAGLKSLIPGAEDWPDFTANLSGQFESRMVMTEILDSESIFFSGMQGARLPVVVAHGEGRASFSDPQAIERLGRAGQISLRFVDNAGLAMERYPYNPNGSPDGITGLCASDGRVMVMMPHPERVFRTVTNSWHPADWAEHGPWLRMFQNARAFVG